MQLVEYAKKYKNALLMLVVLILTLPIMGTLIEIIFTYGTYIGTFIRNISENGICF